MKTTTYTCDACSAAVGLYDTRCPSCGRIFDAVRCPRCDFRGPPGAFVRGCPSCGFRAPSRARRSLFGPLMTVLVVFLVVAGALAWWVRG